MSRGSALLALGLCHKIVIFALELRKRTFLYLACALLALGLCYKIEFFELELWTVLERGIGVGRLGAAKAQNKLFGA